MRRAETLPEVEAELAQRIAALSKASAGAGGLPVPSVPQLVTAEWRCAGRGDCSPRVAARSALRLPWGQGFLPSAPRGDGRVRSHEKGVKALQEAEQRALLQVVSASMSTILVDAPLVRGWSGEIRTSISGKVKKR